VTTATTDVAVTACPAAPSLMRRSAAIGVSIPRAKLRDDRAGDAESNRDHGWPCPLGDRSGSMRVSMASIVLLLYDPTRRAPPDCVRGRAGKRRLTIPRSCGSDLARQSVYRLAWKNRVSLSNGIRSTRS
jgi:hypothetical protein